MSEKPIHVLIVDDEERFRETTARILERRGFVVTAVGNGAEAVQKVKEGGIDVVVLDVKMPGMDGHEALREIKRLNGNLPVLMLTGHGTPDSADEGIRDGVHDYLAKPCSIEFLARKVTEANSKRTGVSMDEPRVGDIMVPLDSFSRILEDQAVSEAVRVLLDSFRKALRTTTIQETVHRSVLVLDRQGRVIGMVTLSDLLRGLQPLYMSLMRDRPLMADTIDLEAPGTPGMFTIMARDLADKRVSDIMSEAPALIDSDESLMAAANKMLRTGLRRFLVMEGSRPAGVIREQDLFFELANIFSQL